MHRRCLRSSVLYAADSTKRYNYVNLQHASFSSSFTPSKNPTTSKPHHGNESKTIKSSRVYKGRPLRPNPATNDSKPLPNMPTNVPMANIPTPVRGLRPVPLKPQLDTANSLAAEEEGQDQYQIEGTEPDDIDALVGSFLPGTFVELRRNNKAIEGIVLTEILEDSTWLVATLTSNGEVLKHLRPDVHFAVPNVISADVAARCGLSRTPEGPQNLNARLETLKKMRIMSIQAEQAIQGSRMWDRQKIVNIYDEVKSNDPTKWTEVTLEHATNLLYTEPGFINYYATHKYLMDRPLRYIAGPGYLQTQTFAVRPQRDIEEIQLVGKWITDYRTYRSEGPYQNFIKKATQVVKNYEDDTQTGPMSQEEAAFPWGESDQVFLRFLLRSLQQHRTNQLDPYEMGRHSLIKDILPKGPPITDSLIHETVIKLGIIAPWQDLYALSHVANPHGILDTSFPLEKERTTIFNKALASKSTTGAVLGPFDFRPSDPLESVRHDFGDARVFVIDDPSAQELDDGVSLERIPSEPNNHWIHVHIADPARHLHPGHALCHLARKQSSSLYLASGNYPMFPRLFMHDPKFGMSLNDTSISEEPNLVLTFSVKLDDKANILDYKLRAGILRNVRKTSYDDVDLALGNASLERLYPFGRSSDIQNGPPLSQSDVADLQILQKLANDQVLHRVREGIFIPSQSFSETKFTTTPPDELQSPYLRGAKFQGFPAMEYSVLSNGDMDRGARNLVSEMMKLAGRIASRVAIDNNVPLIRRSINSPILGPDVDVNEILVQRDSAGYIPYQDYIKFGSELPSGRYTLRPERHAFLAIPDGEGYSRATSPLRRYLDLVVHWQLHHILLGANAPTRPPFDDVDLEKLSIETSIQDVLVRRIHKANNYFYSLMCIKRYADTSSLAGELPLGHPLKSMRAWTKRKLKKHYQGGKMAPVQLPDLGIHAYLEDVPSEMTSLPVGVDLRVTLKSVELGLRRTALLVTLLPHH